MLERVFGWILMPVLRRIVYGALYCNKPGAKERSLQVVEAIFKEVVWFSILLNVSKKRNVVHKGLSHCEEGFSVCFLF